MRQETLFEEAEQRADLSQWYTPPGVAQRIAEWTLQNHPDAKTILEPGAGQGALIRPLLKESKDLGVMAVEIDPNNEKILSQLGERVHVIGGDFLNAEIPELDGTVMNPPYEEDQDAKFVMKALEHTPWVVALLRAVIFHGVNRWKIMWRRVNIVREVKFIERPHFGGDYTTMQDFVLLELIKREKPRERGEPVPVMSVEWW